MVAIVGGVTIVGDILMQCNLNLSPTFKVLFDRVGKNILVAIVGRVKIVAFF